MSLQRSRIAGSVPRRSGPAQYPVLGADADMVPSFVDRVAKSTKNLTTDQLSQYGIVVQPLPIIMINERKALVNNEDVIAMFLLAILFTRCLYRRNLQATKTGYMVYIQCHRDHPDTRLAWDQVIALDAILAGKDSPWTPEVKKFIASLWDELVLSAPETHRSSRVTYASLMWVREVIRLANGIE